MSAAAGQHSMPALRWSAVICLCLAILLWVGPNAARPDLPPGDAAQHVFWLYKNAEPALFPHDPSVEYFSSSSVAPLGYRACYGFLTAHMDAQSSAYLMAAMLLTASGVLAWLLGAAVYPQRREYAGLFAILAMIWFLPHGGTDIFSPMGFQRSFALPLTLMCAWALETRRYAWVGVSWLLAALFYPIVIVVLGMTATVVFMLELLRTRRMPSAWVSNAVLGAAAIAVVLACSSLPAGLGPLANYTQALSMPEFGPEGRMATFGKGWEATWLGDGHIGLGWTPRLLLVIALAAGVSLWRRGVRIPTAIWALLGSGLITWLVARIVMFDLYMPNRHARWSVAVFGIVAISLAATALVERMSGAQRNPSRLVALLAPLWVLAVLLPSAAHIWKTPRDVDLERAYAFIGRMPVATLVAAHPDLADFVPLRSRRSVLASTEESQPFVLGFYGKMKPLLETSLRAAYATRWEDIDHLLVPLHVTVMLTSAEVWNKSSYYAPFKDLVNGLIANGPERGYVLQHPTADRVLFRSGDVYVVRVGP